MKETNGGHYVMTTIWLVPTFQEPSVEYFEWFSVMIIYILKYSAYILL
jgi:hypothetical protein